MSKHPCHNFKIPANPDPTKYFTVNFSIKELDHHGVSRETDDGWTKRATPSDESTVRKNLQRMAYYLELLRAHINTDPYWGTDGGVVVFVPSNGGFQPRAYINDGPDSWKCTDWYGREGSRRNGAGRIYTPERQKEVFGSKQHGEHWIYGDWDEEKKQFQPRPKVLKSSQRNGVFTGEGKDRERFVKQAEAMPMGLYQTFPLDYEGRDPKEKQIQKVKINCDSVWLWDENQKTKYTCRCKQAKMLKGPWPQVSNPRDIDSRGRYSRHRTGSAMDIWVKKKSNKMYMDPVIIHHKIQELILAGCIPEGGLGLYRDQVHYDFRGHTSKWKGGARANRKWIRYFEKLGSTLKSIIWKGYKKNPTDVETIWRNRYKELKAQSANADSFYASINGGENATLLPEEELIAMVTAPNYYKTTPLYKRFVHWNAGRNPIPGEDIENLDDILRKFVEARFTEENYGFGNWNTAENKPEQDYLQNLRTLCGLSTNKKHTFTMTINGVETKRTFYGFGCKFISDEQEKTIATARFYGTGYVWKRRGNNKIYLDNSANSETRKETNEERANRDRFPIGMIAMSAYLNIMEISHSISPLWKKGRKYTPHWAIYDLQAGTYSDDVYNAWLSTGNLGGMAGDISSPAVESEGQNIVAPRKQIQLKAIEGGKKKVLRKNPYTSGNVILPSWMPGTRNDGGGEE